jgi:hypothetical protein
MPGFDPASPSVAQPWSISTSGDPAPPTVIPYALTVIPDPDPASPSVAQPWSVSTSGDPAPSRGILNALTVIPDPDPGSPSVVPSRPLSTVGNPDRRHWHHRDRFHVRRSRLFGRDDTGEFGRDDIGEFGRDDTGGCVTTVVPYAPTVMPGFDPASPSVVPSRSLSTVGNPDRRHWRNRGRFHVRRSRLFGRDDIGGCVTTVVPYDPTVMPGFDPASPSVAQPWLLTTSGDSKPH